MKRHISPDSAANEPTDRANEPAKATSEPGWRANEPDFQRTNPSRQFVAGSLKNGFKREVWRGAAKWWASFGSARGRRGGGFAERAWASIDRRPGLGYYA